MTYSEVFLPEGKPHWALELEDQNAAHTTLTLWLKCNIVLPL
jgi:hypothetical protein